MVKKILAIIMTLSLLVVPYTAFADTLSEHTHDFSGNAISFGLDVDGISVQFTETSCIEPSCTYVKYDADFLVFHFSYVSDTHLSPDEVSKKFWEWRLKQLGKDSSLDKMDSTNGGSNIPAAGGRNPKGYGDEGKANIDSSGKEILWVDVLGVSGELSDGFSTKFPRNLSAAEKGQGSGTKYTFGEYLKLVYSFKAPVTGLYYIGSSCNPYDFGTFYYVYDNDWKRSDFIYTFDKAFEYSGTFSKGDDVYLVFPALHDGRLYNKAYKYYLNKIPVIVEPLAESGITNQIKITINNNVWNGNIYVDKSNNLTYIYPQYTTINENNEVVTNISTNPIIYNNETYQYYTYDQTTSNYYYITYPNQPTPPPTATPSPTPDPDTVRPVQDMYYRWVLTERRGTDDGGYNAIQVSELVFYDEDKNVISWPSDVTIKSSLDTSWNEPIANLVDNNIKNKWGCNKWGNRTTGNCVIDIFAPNMQVPSYYGYVTGSDMPARDPVSWKLYYSFDGLKYYEASTIEQAADIPTGRNTETEKWPFNYQSPTPLPTPTPAPGEDTGDTPTIIQLLESIRLTLVNGFKGITEKLTNIGVGGSTPETAKPGNSGDKGQSWWEKLLAKIGDAIVDGLLGAVSAVLKLIFKLFSTILSWIIWAVSRVFDLLPFLPPGLGGLLVGGVVVCFVIGIIKFIRG